MKTRWAIVIILLSSLLMGAATFFWWQQQSEPMVNFEPMRCIYSDTIEDDTAVPDWTTDNSIQARSIDPEKFSPYAPLQELTLDDQPLLWERDSGQVVLDNEIFSDLQFVDVTGFSGETIPTVVGQITETDLTDEEWRTVLEFLLKSHLIRTYVHLESELCLDQETNSETAYTTHFTAVHRYCTSDCYEKPFEFTVTVDKQTKKINVQ